MTANDRQASPDSTTEWLRPLMTDGTAVDDRSIRVQALIHIQTLADEGRWGDIDEALRQAKVSDFPEVSLILLLRGTYRFRAALIEWTGFKDRVAEELVARRAPADKLLIGL